MDEPRHLPPAAIRYTLQALGLIAWVWIVAQGIAGGESNGDVAHIFLWVYGWVGVAMASFLIGPGLAVPRPVLHPPRHRAPGSCDGSASTAGSRRLPGAPRPLAGPRRLPRRRLAGARPRARTVDDVHHRRRVHRVDPRDDGPVRARHVARERRGLHGLVPAPRAAGAVRARRRGRSRPAPAVRQRPPRGRLARRPTSSSSPSGSARSCSTGCRRRSPGSTSSACPACPPRRSRCSGSSR